MADIQIQQIRKTYARGQEPAVRDVDLTVRDGEFMVLLGPSGCGKTTLLRLLAGLERPDSGRIAIGSRDVTELPPRKREIAMVFQSYAIFPHMSVYQNIGFGLRMQHVSKSEIQQRVHHAAELVQLGEFLQRYPSQLSGGQRQRVAVARAIVMQPAVLLMDEPLSNLDALLRLQFRAELKKLVAELNTTTIYVTHDQVEALSLGDRIAVMRSGQIIQVGAPMDVYDMPATTFVGGFIGTPPMNFLDATVVSANGHVAVDLGGQAMEAPEVVRDLTGRDVTIGIRAESIDVWDQQEPDTMPAQIDVVEPLGADLLLTVRVGSQQLKLLTRNDFPARPNMPISIRPQQDKLRWFDAAGERVAPAG
jgi:multiple sugar transport system ATP-binding protein